MCEDISKEQSLFIHPLINRKNEIENRINLYHARESCVISDMRERKGRENASLNDSWAEKNKSSKHALLLSVDGIDDLSLSFQPSNASDRILLIWRKWKGKSNITTLSLANLMSLVSKHINTDWRMIRGMWASMSSRLKVFRGNSDLNAACSFYYSEKAGSISLSWTHRKVNSCRWTIVFMSHLYDAFTKRKISPLVYWWRNKYNLRHVPIDFLAPDSPSSSLSTE